jgi:uncharacterized protein
MTAPDRTVAYQPSLTNDGVVGVRCDVCRRPAAPATPRCAACGGTVVPSHFAAAGTVWASTVIHIEVGHRMPPYALAYVDLDDGPRVLGLQRQPQAFTPGTRVVLAPASDSRVWCEVVAEGAR